MGESNRGTYYGTDSGAFRAFEQLRVNDGTSIHADYQVIVAQEQADVTISGGNNEATYRRAHTGA
jgi:hypothetical protein